MIAALVLAPGPAAQLTRPVSAAGEAVKATVKAPAPITGRVLSPPGSPLSGATVSFVVRNDMRKADAVVTATTTTGADGAFRIEPTDSGPGSWMRQTYVMAEAKGFGRWMKQSITAEEPVEIRLRPATKAQLAFSDHAGKPAAGVRVHATILMELGQRIGDSFASSTIIYLPTAGKERLTRTTDADGSCSFEDMPQGAELRFQIEDSRFALSGFDSARAALASTAITAPKRIRLLPAASASGRITLPDGKPVAGVRVLVQDRHNIVSSAVFSDKDGRYTVPSLAPGTYSLSPELQKEVNAGWTARPRDKVTVEKGVSLTGLDFALMPGAVVRGRVLAEQSGEGVPDVQMALREPNPSFVFNSNGQYATTEADGSFFFRVPAGAQELSFVFSRGNTGLGAPAIRKHDITLADGETKTIDFKLPPAPAQRPVTITVKGPDGNVVSGATIERLFKLGRGQLVALSPGSRTGEDGKAELASGNELQLRAIKGKLATAEPLEVNGGENVTLTLSENVLANISGQVVDNDGRPLAGARILYTRWTGDSGTLLQEGYGDENGHFASPDLWPDADYSVSASAGGYGSPGEPEKFRLKPGETHRLAPLVLQKADAFVAGLVVDDGGKPASDVTVTINGTPISTTTDDEGRFRLENLFAGKVHLFARVDNSYADKKAQTGNENVLLVLSRPYKPVAQN